MLPPADNFPGKSNTTHVLSILYALPRTFHRLTLTDYAQIRGDRTPHKLRRAVERVSPRCTCKIRCRRSVRRTRKPPYFVIKLLVFFSFCIEAMQRVGGIRPVKWSRKVCKLETSALNKCLCDNFSQIYF